MSTPALQGIKVIEVGQLLAGPFAGTILGYFGAEVIKIEPPRGTATLSATGVYWIKMAPAIGGAAWVEIRSR